MKETIVSLLIFALLTPLAPAAAADNEFEGFKRYPVESGIIEYTVGGSQSGNETLYFDRWGMREVKYTHASMMGMERNSLILLDGEWTYQIDLDAKTGTKMQNPLLKKMTDESAEKELYRANEEMLKSMGAEKTGSETIAGKTCDVWQINSAGTTVWLWNWLALKTRMQMGGMTVVLEAVSVKIGEKIPPEKFVIPDGVKITEAQPQSIMQQN